MNFHTIDWLIVSIFVLLMVSLAVYTKRFSRSVVDFLAANRSGRRYILAVAEGAAGLGAISFVASFEQHYAGGFPMVWWNMLTFSLLFGLSITGWVIYRFRETRALTMAQFYEMRYSRGLRIMMGLLSFLAGVINFGIFPAVGARFFEYFIGLPQTIGIFGFTISTYFIIMLGLLGISLFFTLIGGQVTVILTDFVQGILVNVIILIMCCWLLHKFSWQSILNALAQAPADASMINPFKMSSAKDFTIWFYMLGAFNIMYSYMAWQGGSAYNSSATNAHEAKMAKIIANWRIIPQSLVFALIPICIFAMLRSPEYATVARNVNGMLATIDNPALRNQVTVTVGLSRFLPQGLMGLFAVLILGSFIGNHEAYLHSWGSIFIQDVVMPFRRRPLTPRMHILLLRAAICGVAVFIFLFSLLFRQSQYIFMFIMITGAIYTGGAGSVILGGLYWKRGSTLGAYGAMITGTTLGLGSLILEQAWPYFYNGAQYPIKGHWSMFIASAASILVYVTISLLSGKSVDLDRLLHRGAYAVREDPDDTMPTPKANLRNMLGLSAEYSTGDRIICALGVVWSAFCFCVFIVGTIIGVFIGIGDGFWQQYWKAWTYLYLAISIIVTLTLTLGGFRDLGYMLRRLCQKHRDQADDGWVGEPAASIADAGGDAGVMRSEPAVTTNEKNKVTPS